MAPDPASRPLVAPSCSSCSCTSFNVAARGRHCSDACRPTLRNDAIPSKTSSPSSQDTGWAEESPFVMGLADSVPLVKDGWQAGSIVLGVGGESLGFRSREESPRLMISTTGRLIPESLRLSSAPAVAWLEVWLGLEPPIDDLMRFMRAAGRELRRTSGGSSAQVFPRPVLHACLPTRTSSAFRVDELRPTALGLVLLLECCSS